MGNTRHTIELNGQLYDAVTGIPVNGPLPVPVLDGFTKRKAAPVALAPAAVPARTVIEKKRATPKAIKPAAKSVQRSTTLMRSVVKKPAVTSSTTPHHTVKKHHQVPTPRLQRAGATNRSALVSKFGTTHRLPLAAQVTSLPVQAPPVIADAPPLDLRQQIAAVTARVPGVTTFERALHNAESHKQPRLKKQKAHRAARRLHVQPRTMRFATALTAGFILGAFFLYQNIPNLAMRVAATRAGVSAQLPGYHPAGFSMNRRIQYSPGQIMVSYHSNSDDRAFKLTQKKTTMDEQALRQQFATATGKPYQVYDNKGKTIYVYDDGSATWVDQGVLYQIEGKSALSSDQLLRLAASI